MSPGLVLLILRIALAVLLYAFLGVLAWLLWQDVRNSARIAAARERPMGSLVRLDDASVEPLLPVTSLGRAPTNTICIADDAVSLQHALITQRDDRWWLEDLGSRNGTTLNEQPLREPVVISPGDIIGVGRVKYKFQTPGVEVGARTGRRTARGAILLVAALASAAAGSAGRSLIPVQPPAPHAAQSMAVAALPRATDSPSPTGARRSSVLAHPRPVTPIPEDSPTGEPAPAQTPFPAHEDRGRFVYGRSVEGRILAGYQFGETPTGARTTFAVVIVGAMHGDEGNGSTFVWELARAIRSGFVVVPPDVTLYLIPDANPDGSAARSRLNANQVDLNRNWETFDWGSTTQTRTEVLSGGGGVAPFSEPETAALRYWLLRTDEWHPQPLRVVFLHAAFPKTGLVLPGSHLVDGQVLADAPSRRFGQALAHLTGYRYANQWPGRYTVTGDASTWAVAQGMIAVTVEFPTTETLPAVDTALLAKALESLTPSPDPLPSSPPWAGEGRGWRRCYNRPRHAPKAQAASLGPRHHLDGAHIRLLVHSERHAHPGF